MPMIPRHFPNQLHSFGKNSFQINKNTMTENFLVAVVMGSQSDWETMKQCIEILKELNIKSEVKVLSAHRAPDALFKYVETLESRGIEVVIAAAGGAAHLPGVIAAKTILPVIGVPMQSKALNGLDSLLSIVQMPKGVPVGTMAIGNAGASNAGLYAAHILSVKYPEIQKLLKLYREEQTKQVLKNSDHIND